MKAFVAALIFFGAFSAHAKSLYVFQKGVPSGRAVSYKPIIELSDVGFAQLFGMNKESDQLISALESQKVLGFLTGCFQVSRTKIVHPRVLWSALFTTKKRNRSTKDELLTSYH